MRKLNFSFKSLLVAAGLLVGSASAWGAPSSYLSTWTGAVGLTDFTSDFNYGSKKIAIADGESYQFTFVNFNNNNSSNADATWIFECTDNNNFVDVRANGGRWVWVPEGGTQLFTDVEYTGSESSVFTSTEIWNKAYNGVTVTLTVSRSGNTISATHTATTNAVDDVESQTYTATYSTTYSGSNDVYFYLTNVASYLEITNVVYTEADGTTTHTYGSAIEALPFSRTWTAQTSTYPFIGGDIVSGTNVKAFRVSNTTATASFDSDASTDGYQPYTISSDETVTVSFSAYLGGVSGSTTSTVQLVNSEDVVLASFTYTQASSNVTDVSFGGTTIAGFEAFKGRSSHTTASKDGNGFASSSYAFVTDAGYNPEITMTVSDNGYVSLRYYTANGYNAIDKNYNATLTTSGVGAVKMDIASIKIIDSNSNADRAIGINNLSITSAVAPKANVTFAFTDTEDNSLSSVKANYVLENVAVGANIEDIIPDAQKATFYNGDASYKYVYSIFACSDETVQAGGSTVTLKFDARAKYNFTAKAEDGDENDLGEIASGYGYANEPTTFYIPACVLDGNKLYFTTSEAYEKSETLTSDGQVLTYEYATNTVDNVVFFAEGESLTGSTSTAPAYKSLASNGYVGRGTDIDVTTLDAGNYTVYVKYYNSTSSSQSLLVKAGDVDVIDESVSVRPTKSGSITLAESTDIKITAAGGSTSGFDYIYIVRTAVPVTIGTIGYTTFASPFALDLTNLPSGLTAYYASAVDDENVTLISKSDEAVAAGTGLVLKGAADTYNIPVAASGSAISGNKLVGCPTASSAYGSDKYVLWNDGGVAKFCNLAYYDSGSPMTIPAGKAYLDAAGGSPAKALRIVFDDGEATGIAAPEVAEKAENGVLYNTAGQQVTADFKGIVIKNGKKFLNK